jgi:hypothetical protein
MNHLRCLLLLAFLAAQPLFILAQCPAVLPVNPGGTPDNCNTALDLNPLFNNPQYVCVNNAGATASGAVQDLAGCLQTDQRDLFFVTYEPCTNIANYNRSFVFRWQDWPNRASGAAPPRLAVHSEIAGNLNIFLNIPYDCTTPAAGQNTDFLTENLFCSTGEQFYLPQNALNCTPFSLPIQGVGTLNVNDIGLFFQAVTSDGGVGDLCFQVSPYRSGFLCGDAVALPLTGNNAQVSGSATACLSSTALNGTMFSNLTNDLPVPCGVEEPAAAWYALTLPFACNRLEVSVPTWAGNGAYNLALLSGVNCPGVSYTDAITGQPGYIAGQTLDSTAIVEAGSCGQPLSICRPLPAGTYWLYVSGATSRPSFTVNVTATNAAPTAGTASSPQDGGGVCSSGSVSLSVSGTVLPFAACGQTLDWFYGTDNAFDPYAGQGTYLGSGTNAQTFSMPVNSGCAPVTYYLKGVVSDSAGSARAICPTTTNTLSVTVYPIIGFPTVNNGPCAIVFTAPCPTFTVNGQTGSFTFVATPADNGTLQPFVMSNGLAACDIVAYETVNCPANCSGGTATVSVDTLCCGQTTTVVLVGQSLSGGAAVAWALTPGASGPVQNAAEAQAAGNLGQVFPANADGSFTLLNDCSLPAGTYFATPFLAADPVVPGGVPTIDPNCESYGAPVILVLDPCTVGLPSPTAPMPAVRVQPNPSSGIFTLSFDAPMSGMLQVFDVQGRLVLSSALNGSDRAILDLGHAAPDGLYLMRFVNGRDAWFGPVLVKGR